MPNAPKTPSRSFRIDDDLWKDFGRVAGEDGRDMTDVLVSFVKWYVGIPGAELPMPGRSRSGEG